LNYLNQPINKNFNTLKLVVSRVNQLVHCMHGHNVKKACMWQVSLLRADLQNLKYQIRRWMSLPNLGEWAGSGQFRFRSFLG